MRLAILSALLFVGQVFAADCSCTGKSDEEVHGGNRDPLRWQSIVRLMDSGSAFNPPWNCFEHRVFNDSENEVTDIFWKVAKFEEDSIPKKDNRCQVYIGEGSIQKPLAEGLLYYSVGKRSYDTRVYAAQHRGEGAKAEILIPRSTPELSSVIEVSNRWTGVKSSIRFQSSVRHSNNLNEFEYGVTTSGSEKLLVYWYVPLTKGFEPMRMDKSSTITAIPGETVRRTARSSDSAGWVLAPVQVFDYGLRWLATGVASAYCSIKGGAQPLLPQPNPRQ